MSSAFYTLSGIFSTLVISLVLKQCCTDRLRRCWNRVTHCCRTTPTTAAGGGGSGGNSSNQASTSQTPPTTNTPTSTRTSTLNLANPATPKPLKNNEPTPHQEQSLKNSTPSNPENPKDDKMETWVKFDNSDDEPWEEGYWDPYNDQYVNNEDIELVDTYGKKYPLRYCGENPAWTVDGYRLTLGFKDRAMEYVLRKQVMRKLPLLRTEKRIIYANKYKIVKVERPNPFLDTTKLVKYEDLLSTNPTKVSSYELPISLGEKEAGNSLIFFPALFIAFLFPFEVVVSCFFRLIRLNPIVFRLFRLIPICFQFIRFFYPISLIHYEKNLFAFFFSHSISERMCP